MPDIASSRFLHAAEAARHPLCERFPKNKVAVQLRTAPRGLEFRDIHSPAGDVIAARRLSRNRLRALA